MSVMHTDAPSLDDVIERVAAYYWLRPSHLSKPSGHRVVKVAHRIVAYYGAGVAPKVRVAEAIGRSRYYVGRNQRLVQLQLAALDRHRALGTRTALDARAIGRRLALCA